MLRVMTSIPNDANAGSQIDDKQAIYVQLICSLFDLTIKVVLLLEMEVEGISECLTY
jgi:hypothetical protein